MNTTAAPRCQRAVCVAGEVVPFIGGQAEGEMGFAEYRRKRDFKKTPEPPPERKKTVADKLAYLIQKHDASRLHYDFRLELDGVLLSWAVTKGPSLDPADKRLAVRTEDHPLAYGSFEGTIPKGEYGGGTVLLWDNGTWEPEGDPRAGLNKGHIAFTLHGSRLKGKWDLVRMNATRKRENWLLIKRDDAEARRGTAGEFLKASSSSVKTGRTLDEIAGGRTTKEKPKSNPASKSALDALSRRFPQVQLATLADRPPAGSNWVHEVKHDGYRLLGFVSGGAALLRTRNGNDWTSSFPSLAGALVKLKVEEAVLDLEAVSLDASGKSSFQALQAALGEGGDPSRIVAYVFDLLWLDGKDLTSLPLTERKEILRSILNKSRQSRLRYSEHVPGEGAEMFARACRSGLEGIVSKQADARYLAGRQSSWLKIKCGRRQEFIILGFSDAKSGGRALGALYLGYRKDGALKYAGKVGTGFSMDSARRLVSRFARLSLDKPVLTRAETVGLPAGEWRSIHWLEPSLLCEVSFTEWTADGRIRHPSFHGLREDKGAMEVEKEMPIKTASKSTGAKAKPDKLIVSGVAITHPGRVIDPASQVTKGELAEYYAAVAALILPQIARRPLSLLRCPSGIGGECFFQRNPGKGLGAGVLPFEFKHEGRKFEYLYIEDEQGLLEVVQMGAIELHPWAAPIDAIDFPDRMIFDLDPGSGVPFEAVKLGAGDLRRRLRDKGLESVLKCTGGKGLHVTVPLAGKDPWPAVKSFAASIARDMVAAAPDAYIATMSKARRAGRIFIDYLRNDYTATAIADYAVRARPGAPVALPVEWKELEKLESASQFTIKDVMRRVKGKRSNPVTARIPQTLPAE